MQQTENVTWYFISFKRIYYQIVKKSLSQLHQYEVS